MDYEVWADEGEMQEVLNIIGFSCNLDGVYEVEISMRGYVKLMTEHGFRRHQFTMTDVMERKLMSFMQDKLEPDYVPEWM
jgi:hypothetical protein